MKQYHVAISTLTGNGHVHAILPLCSELVRRGHRVTYATSSHYAEKIAQSGAEPVLFRSAALSKTLDEEVKSKFALPCDDPGWWDMSADFLAHEFERIASAVAQVEGFYRQNVPDVVLYDPVFPVGRILSHLFGCPAVRASGHFAYYKNLMFRDKGVCCNPAPIQRKAQALDIFLAAYGITTPDNLWHLEELNIQLIPKEFQYENAWFDERFCFSGALLGRPSQSAWRNTTGQRNVILVSDLSGIQEYGTYARSYFGLFAEALANTEFHCVLSVDAGFDADLLGPMPANVEINRKSSHLEILPSTAVLVCHGGMLTTLEAVYCEVPVLMLPPHPGCEEVAYRTAELGLGTHLPRSGLTVARATQTIRAMVADTNLSNRVRRMAQVFKQSGGAALAADRIEGLLAAKGMLPC